MSRLRVQAFTLSIDGFGAGPKQDLDNPIGVGGLKMMDWARSTRTFQQMHGTDGGTVGVDDDFAARGFDNIGAWILGRNMCGPIRGPWPDKEAAGGKDARVGGGVATIPQYLRAGLVNELHLAVAPELLGTGEHLLSGIDLLGLGYQCTEHVPTERATHVVLTKRTI